MPWLCFLSKYPSLTLSRCGGSIGFLSTNHPENWCYRKAARVASRGHARVGRRCSVMHTQKICQGILLFRACCQNSLMHCQMLGSAGKTNAACVLVWWDARQPTITCCYGHHLCEVLANYNCHSTSVWHCVGRNWHDECQRLGAFRSSGPSAINNQLLLLSHQGKHPALNVGRWLLNIHFCLIPVTAFAATRTLNLNFESRTWRYVELNFHCGSNTVSE